jgi:hypothetical protein
MKILHLSHNGLPDIRVERAARTGRKAGHTVSFAGPFLKRTHLPNESFEKVYTIPFNKFVNARVPLYWGGLKRKIVQILRKTRFDLVHAHNLVAAKLASEISVPFIYDDHEYWSKKCKLKARMSRPNKMYIKLLYSKWEKDVLHKTPATITVSRTIANEHKRLCSHVFVAPNFPSRVETEPLELDLGSKERLSSVYVGRNFSRFPKDMGPHRNVEGCLQIFSSDDVGTLTVIGDPDLTSSRNVNSLGFLRHHILMEELTKHHIGLVPWKKHWKHKYSNTNKAYEYAHAGLIVLAVSDLINVKYHLKKYCNVFDDLYELKEMLTYYADNLDELRRLRFKVRKFALKNLIWERKCGPQILRAYSKI